MPHELTVNGTPPTSLVTKAVLDVVLHIPQSRESPTESPARRAREIARAAARNASMTAGSLALPPGVLGWLTVIPELMAVWRIQAQMVADIAASYGKTSALGKEQMLYCLFKQVAAQALRDVAVRVGERIVLQRLSSRVMQTIAQKLGVQVTQTLLKKGVSRWLPVLGAMGVGAYAYADTLQVGRNAMALFEDQTLVEQIEK